MWFYTKFGFFSVVAHRDLKDIMVVRGRSKADMQEFVGALHASASQYREHGALVPDDFPIVETRRADYKYRIIAHKNLVAAAVSIFVVGVDYTNFKDKVAEAQGPARFSIYHDVWAATRRIEAEEGK